MSSEPCEGEGLHRRIGAEKWCITKADLRSLRRSVKKAVKLGEIRSTDADYFDPQDEIYGPSIHVVTNQYIKPVTARAGGMSWALMKHPEGLPCDLFVTHSWQEGIYEFISKVLNSWPNSSRHAWICMLALPQNLNISDLIHNPSHSPFAVALHDASHVLVVPNRTGSIYGRLWCVYEAFLAHQWDKVILTAMAPSTSHVGRIMMWLSFAVLLGLNIGVWLPCSALVTSSLTYNILWYLLMIVSVLGRSNLLRKSCNLTGVAASVAYALFMCRIEYRPRMRSEGGLSREMWDVLYANELQNALVSLVFFSISEFDREKALTADREAGNLSKGYTGSVLDARCSVRGDADRIQDEIGEQVSKVDNTVAVLIRAGMSTRMLREAFELGVDVESFTQYGYAFHMLMWGVSVPQRGGLSLEGRAHYLIFLEAPTLILGLCWLVFWWRSPVDVRIYSYLVIQKVSMCCTWPFQLLAYAMRISGDLSSFGFFFVCDLTVIISWLLILPTSWAGLHNVARIPRVGPKIAQFLVCRGFRKFRKIVSSPGMKSSPSCLRGSSPESTDDTSASEASDDSAESEAERATA